MAHKQKKTGGNLTVFYEAIITEVSVSSVTSVILSVENSERTYLEISNSGNKTLWVKFQKASIDNDKKGILLKGDSVWRMPENDKYKGEISGIMDSGPSATISIQEA